MGIEIDLQDDLMLVKGGTGVKGATTHSHHDHRIAMACAVAALKAEGQVVIEEAEAINWYQQRISVEKNRTARAIMRNAQNEEFKHFGMDLEFLLRQTPAWRAVLQVILFKEGDIVEHGEEAEEAID